MYVHVCMGGYTYACMHVCRYVWKDGYMYVHMHVCMCMCVYVSMYYMGLMECTGTSHMFSKCSTPGL